MVYYNNPDERAKQDALDAARGYSYLKSPIPDWTQNPDNPDWAANNPYASQGTPYVPNSSPITDPWLINYLQQQGYTPSQIQSMKMTDALAQQAGAPPPQQTRRSVAPPPQSATDFGKSVAGAAGKAGLSNVASQAGAGTLGEAGSLASLGTAAGVGGVGAYYAPSYMKYGNMALQGTGDKSDVVKTAALTNPMTSWAVPIVDKISGLWSSGKPKDQKRRDQVRKVMQQHGMFGTSGDDWTLDNPDNTGFDVGKDGGAQYNGHKYYETDLTNAPQNQSAAKAGMDPLAYLITGGDKELAPEFSGYFTNTVVQGAGGKDLNVLKANILDKYKKAGFDTPEKAQAGIAELVKAGKIDQATGQTLSASVMAAFSPAAPMGTRRSGPMNPNASNNNMARRRAAGENRRRRTQAQSYAPQVYAPNVLSPTSTSNGYNEFGQGLANVYQQNQQGLV